MASIRKVFVDLFRGGNASSPRLDHLRTIPTHPSNKQFDFPVYKQNGNSFITSSRLAPERKNPLEDEAASTKQADFFRDVATPYGVSVYGIPFYTDHLWKLQAVAEIPASIDVQQLSHRYFHLTLVNDMMIDAAKKLYSSTHPKWIKVPRGEIPTTPPEQHYDWRTKVPNISTIVVQYVRSLRVEQAELRKKGDLDGVVDIDNEIMGIICGGLSVNEGGWPQYGVFPAHHGADMTRIARLEFA